MCFVFYKVSINTVFFYIVNLLIISFNIGSNKYNPNADIKIIQILNIRFSRSCFGSKLLFSIIICANNIRVICTEKTNLRQNKYVKLCFIK